MKDSFVKDRPRELPGISDAAREYVEKFLREEHVISLSRLEAPFRAEVVAVLSHRTGLTEDELTVWQIDVTTSPYILRKRLTEGEKVDAVLGEVSDGIRRRVAQLVDEMVPGLTLAQLQEKPTELMLRWHEGLVITD